MVFNEARVLNVPIVTTDFGSAHEFVTDGVDGYIRPIEKIPDVISDICLDLGKYQNLHKNSVPKYIVNNEIKLKIISATGLTEDEINGITDKYKKVYNAANVSYEQFIDESVIGGVKVVIGNKVYDGTVKTQLNNML